MGDEDGQGEEGRDEGRIEGSGEAEVERESGRGHRDTDTVWEGCRDTGAVGLGVRPHDLLAGEQNTLPCGPRARGLEWPDACAAPLCCAHLSKRTLWSATAQTWHGLEGKTPYSPQNIVQLEHILLPHDRVVLLAEVLHELLAAADVVCCQLTTQLFTPSSTHVETRNRAQSSCSWRDCRPGARSRRARIPPGRGTGTRGTMRRHTACRARCEAGR